MSEFADLLRQFRKSKGVTQASLAEAMGLNRPVIGAYEEGRAEPKMEILRKMARYFGITVDELVSGIAPKSRSEIRVLPIVVDSNTHREKVSLVPVKAAAGYLSGFHDPSYIEQLDVFDLPFRELHGERTYRMFQIEGDSMLPIPDHSYIITDFVTDWETLREGDTYVVVSRTEGIVFKRVYLLKQTSSLRCVSDNEIYPPFEIPFNEIQEIWRAKGYVSFDL